MQDRQMRCSRRKFLAASAAALSLAGGADADGATAETNLSRSRPKAPSTKGRKPIAVITTVYRPLSHSYHIAGRFLHGYARGDKLHVPNFYVHSLCVEQSPENDLSREVGREFGARVTKSISDALLQDGKLAVDGVLLIGEHGNYPRNDKGQILYPRYEMMEQIVAAFRKAGRSVPVFNDKHLSYTVAKARTMAGWAHELKFPLMAGSSLPVTWRRPELELKLDTPIEDGLVAGYGPIEVYGFHALEALQVMMERRKGGETGIKAVTCLTGKEVWKAGDEGKWSWDLLDAALARSETVNPGDIRKNVGGMPVQSMPATPAIAFLIEYRDGTRGTVLLLNGHIQDFCFAAKVKGETKTPSCMFYLPPPPGARYFDAQVANIEKLLETRHSPYPVDRTILTTGALDTRDGKQPSSRPARRDAGVGAALRGPTRQRLLTRQPHGRGRSLMRTTRRFLVLVGLLFWIGGFTFYAGVVVPIGRHVLSQQLDLQGHITSAVTNWLNISGSITLTLILWDLLSGSAAETGRWRVRGLCWLVMALTLGVLVWLHVRLDGVFLGSGMEMDWKSFRPLHRIYLWVSTAQWGAALVYLWLSVKEWSRL